MDENKEAAQKGNPFPLHLSGWRTLGCKQRQPLGLGCRLGAGGASPSQPEWINHTASKIWALLPPCCEFPCPSKTPKTCQGDSLRLLDFIFFEKFILNLSFSKRKISFFNGQFSNVVKPKGTEFSLLSYREGIWGFKA